VFDGWCATQGFDPLDLPSDRLCNVVYYWLARRAKNERELAELDAQLERVPDGVDVDEVTAEGTWSAEGEMAAFAAASKAASGAT
jgi:hypothetical protein